MHQYSAIYKPVWCMSNIWLQVLGSFFPPVIYDSIIDDIWQINSMWQCRQVYFHVDASQKLHFYIYSRWQMWPCMKIQWDAINKQYKYDALPHTLAYYLSWDSVLALKTVNTLKLLRSCLSWPPGSALVLSSSDNCPTLLSANKN